MFVKKIHRKEFGVDIDKTKKKEIEHIPENINTEYISEKLKKFAKLFAEDNKTGAITFLDVLGWKGIWSRDPNAIEKIEWLANELEGFAVQDTKGKTFGKTGAYTLETKIVIISDTLVITTLADNSISTDAIILHGKLSKIAINESIKKGIPVRGASCFGEFIISENKNILVGKAVDEAASWYERANWIGVLMTPSAYFMYKNGSSEIWTEYPPPFKENINFKTLTVNWLENAGDIDNIKNKFSLMSPILPEFIDKFQNTIEYLSNLKNR
jgi:hypothetical protein